MRGQRRPLRRHQDSAPFVLRDCLDRRKPGRRHHHHPATAPIGLVVDDAVPVLGVVAKIVDLHAEQALVERAADETRSQEGLEELWEDGQDVDVHVSNSPSGRSSSNLPSSTSTRRR